MFVWHCLCRRSHGQHSRHLRRPPLHQNADSHQFVHFEFGGGRRMFSHRHSIYYDDNGPGILAIWQRHVQGEITLTPTKICDRLNCLVNFVMIDLHDDDLGQSIHKFLVVDGYER